MSSPATAFTDTGRSNDRERSLGYGYVRTISDQLSDESQVMNAGVSGNRVIDLQRRWADDVYALEPGHISVLVGVNDTLRRYDSGDPTSVENFEEIYREILGSAHTPRPILMEPFLLPISGEQEMWFEDLRPKQLAVQTLAEEFNAVFVHLQSMFDDAALARGRSLQSAC